MTRLATQPATAGQKPDTILFGELAIAAGFVGKPVALCFTESAAAIDCELWKYLARFADPSRVLHIHRQADVTEFKKGLRLWRVAIVHVERLHAEVAWMVETHTSDTVSRPTILSRSTTSAFDDAPIPTIILRGNELESAHVLRSLFSSCSQTPVLPDEPPIGGVEIDATLVPAITPGTLPNGRGPKRLDHCRIVAALLSGAALLRSMSIPNSTGGGLIAGQAEYQLVRRLLQSPLVHSAHDVVEKLAVEMANRANVYVDLKTTMEYWHENPLRVQEGDPILKLSGSRTNKDLVTRKEIVDLGNVRSKLVRDMLEFLKRIPDGYARFTKMGLVREPPDERAWSITEPQSLTSLLRSWSPKQVRTHFDGLRKAGLITGVRDQSNGPWKYELPEELNSASSPFRSLPPTNELYPPASESA